MPCLFGCLALMMPRVVIVVLVIFTNYMHSAYNTYLWPILGFIFAPYTTLAYAWAINKSGSVSGWFIIVMIIAVMLDLGSYGSSAKVKTHAHVRVGRGRR